MTPAPLNGARRSRRLSLAVILLTALSCVACAAGATGERVISLRRADADRLVAKTSIVSYPVEQAGQTWHTAGLLNVPYAGGQRPRAAIVIVHGSGGVDSRGAGYAEALNRAGFVTLEIDLWAPRHVRSAADRPKSVMETLPDAFGALAFLSAQTADVDPHRIGITGFSWGGVVSMLSATRANADRFAAHDQSFAAHAPLYPVCWVYNKVPGYEFTNLTGAPVFIQAGDADTYDAPDRCVTLQQSLPPASRALVSVRMHAGATHAWERREPDATISDPFAHEGRGGEVDLRYNEQATRESTRAIVAFFQRALENRDATP